VWRLPLAISRIVSRNRILCEAVFQLFHWKFDWQIFLLSILADYTFGCFNCASKNASNPMYANGPDFVVMYANESCWCMQIFVLVFKLDLAWVKTKQTRQCIEHVIRVNAFLVGCLLKILLEIAWDHAITANTRILQYDNAAILPYNGNQQFRLFQLQVFRLAFSFME